MSTKTTNPPPADVVKPEPPLAPESRAKTARKVRMTDSQWKALSAEAKELTVSVPEVLRRAVDHYLNRNSHQERMTMRMRNLERRVADLEGKAK